MTYQEKLEELRTQSLTDQKEFLQIIEEIRKITLTGEPVEEKLLFKRDQLYHQFNKALKEHRRLLSAVESNQIDPDAEYTSTDNSSDV
jgi:hypothetical protein